MPEPIRVLLADDHPLVRTGLRSVLTMEEDMLLVGEATDGHEAQSLSRERAPDVLLLDVSMPGPSALDTIRYLNEHGPDIKVLVVTAYDRSDFVHSLTSAGVAGYILKDETMDLLVEAIRTVHGGGTYFSRGVIDKAVQQEEAKAALDLTDREQEVLSLLVQAWDNKQIADQLALSEQTVRNYVSRVYDKLELHSRAEVIIWAQENGFTDSAS